MNLLRYIKENAPNSDIDIILPEIEKTCSKYIKDLRSGRNMFFRMSPKYISIADDLVYISTVATNRKPVDTPREVSKGVDDLLKSRFGWKPRSDGLFVWITKKSEKSWRWSPSSRVIFPSNDYKYVYSPTIADLYTDCWESYENEYESSGLDPNSLEDSFLSWFSRKELPGYTDKNALSFIQPSGWNIECMIKAKKVYAISTAYIESLNAAFNVKITPS